MNKAELADQLAARGRLSKVVAKEAVDGVFAVVGDALASGQEVRIAGFGTFGTRHRPDRTQPENRRVSFDIGINVVDIQGREDAEGWCQCWSRIMTLQRQLTATGDNSIKNPAHLLR